MTFRRLSFLVAFLAAVPWTRPASASIIEKVIAIVDQTPILLTDLQERSKPFLQRVYQAVPPGPQRNAAISQIMKTVLERMIEEELEDNAASRAGVTVPSEEIDAALARVASQNNISVDTLLKEARRSGLTTEQYREELRRQLLQAKMSSMRLAGRIRVEESDVRAAYRALVLEERNQQVQRTVRVVMPLGSSAAEQADNMARAEEVTRRARAGEEFSALVGEFGVLPGSGLAPATPPQAEPKPIGRASLGLEVGDVSRPVRVGNTLVVLQVVERAPSSLPSFDEAREAIYQRVYMEKMSKARAHWLSGLRRRTHVEVRM
jgi:peptidyl-prolyl cis-trans isomerase SurA